MDELIAAMRSDKKVRAGEIRFALPRAIGTPYGDDTRGWTTAVEPEDVHRILSAG